MDKIFLGLGSNVGDRYYLLQRAITTIANHQKISIVNQSSIYETKPFGFLDQPDFLNMVIEMNTTLLPEELLNFTQSVEQDLGRTRTIHWGPRTIDIDILLYGDQLIQSDRLTIPHPFLKERLFVLLPLQEITKGIINLPGISLSLEQLIKEIESDEGDVKIWRT